MCCKEKMTQLKTTITFDLDTCSRTVSTQNDWIDDQFLKMEQPHNIVFIHALENMFKRLNSAKNGKSL